MSPHTVVRFNHRNAQDHPFNWSLKFAPKLMAKCAVQWDSYFIILRLLELGGIALAKGMIDNFSYLYQRFAIMPTRNRWANLGISQAPYFTSMIEEVYRKTQDTAWLQVSAEIAERDRKDHRMDAKRAERHPGDSCAPGRAAPGYDQHNVTTDMSIQKIIQQPGYRLRCHLLEGVKAQ